MAELSVPLLNRIVDAMLEHADPKADQNIWNLARAAEEVMREVKSEQLAAAYGGQMQTMGPLGVGWRRGDGGRVQVARDRIQPEELQERIGTEIEHNSAEMLRRVLGAGKNETLGAAAKRVAESAKSGWEQHRSLNDRQNNELHQLNTAIRDIVAAVDEYESDDHYMPGQPTTDAVRRVVARLIEVDRHPDGSRKTAHEILDVVQDDWDGNNELSPFSWERTHSGPKPAFSGPRYVARKSGDNPEFDDWAVWDKKTGDWFTAIDVGTRNEAERRAVGLNETEDA